MGGKIDGMNEGIIIHWAKELDRNNNSSICK
jgi:hypothetical protein